MPTSNCCDHCLTSEAVKLEIGYVREKLDDVSDRLVQFEEKFVTQVEFGPVKKAVWGAVSLIGLGFVSALATVAWKAMGLGK